jgi:hypothetical protein
MLEVVHKLIKYIQKCDVFIIDFFDMVRSIEAKIYWLYVDPFYKYEDFAFFEFIVICEHYNEQLPLVWVTHENETNFYCLPFLAFDIGDQKYGLHHHGGVKGV